MKDHCHIMRAKNTEKGKGFFLKWKQTINKYFSQDISVTIDNRNLLDQCLPLNPHTMRHHLFHFLEKKHPK